MVERAGLVGRFVEGRAGAEPGGRNGDTCRGHLRYRTSVDVRSLGGRTSDAGDARGRRTAHRGTRLSPPSGGPESSRILMDQVGRRGRGGLTMRGCVALAPPPSPYPPC